MDDTIGSFSITGELGRGGMGVVYRAVDTRLGRDVAIKALPDEFAADPVRLERFEREARVLAQVTHANIAGIYGIEEEDGARYLVLEYVEGETLADLLERGPMPPDDAIEIAAQIADGVAAAHDAGVIHRDLKPGNVIITPDGRAKVLDFGLARADGVSDASSGEMTQSPTATYGNSPTIPGAILGTAPYMSPEQARGKMVDKRTDIWSFGVMLYEMLTGTGPFHGETATESIGAILHKDVDLDALPPGMPVHVRRVLERCLERDKDARFRDIGDVRLELLTVPEPGAAAGASSPGAGSRSGVGWAAAGVLLAAGLVVGAAVGVGLAGRAWPDLGGPAGTDRDHLVRLSVPVPPDIRLRLKGDMSGPAVVSPDGTRIVFSATREGETRRLWMRGLDGSGVRELRGTDGGKFPFWSPDGRWFAFYTTNSLMKYDTQSDTVVRVCESGQGRGGAWTEDGRIVFAPGFRGGLQVVDANGGEPGPMTVLDEELHSSHRWPCIIPGTDRFVYTAVSNRPGEESHNGIYLASLQGGGEPTRVMQSNHSAVFASGHLVSVLDGRLLAWPFDPDGDGLTGESVVLALDVDADLATWHGQVSVSNTGVLVYGSQLGGTAESGMHGTGRYSWDVQCDQIVSYTADGGIVGTYAMDTPIRTFHLNQEGTAIAYETFGDDGYIDIWVQPVISDDDETPGGTSLGGGDLLPQRFTSLPGIEAQPIWSPAGDEIAFRWSGDETRPRGIYRKRLGGGAARLVRDNHGGDDFPADWTPDGAHLLVVSGTLIADKKNDVWALPVDGGDTIPLVTDPGTDTMPKISPDGRWLAYSRIDSGLWEVRVVPFAPAWPDGGTDRRWVVSQGGGIMPSWGPEGDELFYIDLEGNLMSVSVELSGETFVHAPPRPLFDTSWEIGRRYDVIPEGAGAGGRFLFMDMSNQDQASISVLLNWERLVGG